MYSRSSLSPGPSSSPNMDLWQNWKTTAKHWKIFWHQNVRKIERGWCFLFAKKQKFYNLSLYTGNGYFHHFCHLVIQYSTIVDYSNSFYSVIFQLWTCANGSVKRCKKIEFGKCQLFSLNNWASSAKYFACLIRWSILDAGSIIISRFFDYTDQKYQIRYKYSSDIQFFLQNFRVQSRNRSISRYTYPANTNHYRSIKKLGQTYRFSPIFQIHHSDLFFKKTYEYIDFIHEKVSKLSRFELERLDCTIISVS